MPSKYQRRTAGEERRYRRGWKRATVILSLLVALTTTGALVLPAITMNKNVCGIEEHQHTKECYEMSTAHTLVCNEETLGVHQHQDSCYDESGALICNLVDFVVHTHETNCYAEDGTLLCEICEMEEHIHDTMCYELIEAESEHSHDDDCYVWVTGETLLCDKPEDEEHTHTEECYELVKGDLSCTEEATNVVSVLKCEKPQIILHSHEDSCYIAEAEINESTEAWILDLIDQQQNAKTETAVDGESEDVEGKRYLICTQAEVSKHQHTDACFAAEEPLLICELPEHTHTSDCEGFDLLSGEGLDGISEDEQNEIYDVIALIDAFASIGEIEDNLSEKEGEELLAYKVKITAQINGALETYKALSDKQKTFVTNYEKLSEYTYLLTDDLSVKEVVDKIGGLPSIEEFEEKYESFSSIQKPVYVEEVFAQITEIAALYDAFTEEQKALVLNYNKVTELEAHLTEMETAEDAIEFVGDDYTTSVIASPEAELPENTVITARPLFDSNELTVSTFSAVSDSSNDEGSAYMEDVLDAITWGEVTRIKLFDITLMSDNDEVQPSAPVEVRTEFTEPLNLDSEEVLYGVHIGENGAEILPANTERDENGNIVAVTHTQSSFSPTGYVLVHVSNPKDIGPDILPVHYCLWVNEQWIIVGSSRTGWYGDYTNKYDWTTDTRDYITLAQMGSVLEQYGLDIEDLAQVKKTIWYQRAEEVGKTIRKDTDPVQKEINGEMQYVFLLSGNMLKDDGYHIYFVPEGTLSSSETEEAPTYSDNSALAADLKQASKFYSFTVRDMNNIVYSLEEENDATIFPQAKVVQYGKPISVTVKQNLDDNGENLGWQWVNDKGGVVHGIKRLYGDSTTPDERFGYTDNGDGTETYSFSGILGRTTLIPFSDAVDGATQNTNKQVDIAVYLDDKWQKVGQLNLMYKHDGVCKDENGEEYWFITAGQVYTILKDFGFHPELYHPDDETDTGHFFTHAVGSFDEAGMTMCANCSNTILDGTVAIGFGHEHDGTESDVYTLFYLPGSANEGFDNVHGKNSKEYGESELIQGDRFYSVKIVDDYQLVYYGYETDNFKAYVPEGNSVTVKVENALSVLWSVVGLDDVTATQEGNFNVYQLNNVTAPVKIVATSLNPSFTVQYYANIERYQLSSGSGDGKLPLINTEGGKLPTNVDSLPETYLQLTPVDKGSTTDQNAGVATPLYKVATYIDNTEIYKPKEFVYEKSHNWHNIDKLWQNEGYQIEGIWILKEGMDPESEDEDDWWIYTSEVNGENITFTNLASEENAPKDESVTIQAGGNHTILITEGMVIRLQYYLAESDYTDSDVKFYDYDISSDGTNVGQKGINSIYNSLSDVSNSYAFGNDNCFTGMGSAIWNNQKLNQYNGDVYKGCTFGLVTGIASDGGVTWAANVKAPNIFGSGTAAGRTDYTGSLTFHRKGDVYTLSNSQVLDGSRNKLNYFFNPSPTNNTIYDGVNNAFKSNIFTNNFWALDGVTGTDGHWGEYNDRGTVNGYENGAADNTRGSYTTGETLPPSDDGNNHNWFFGMNFGISFNISEDYTGPLEYIFFGDDDMWVFLDGQLICDIGGVHSAVGEYVDLRDYLPIGGENTTGSHTLRFYYTERGASGSTCWMSFTLPSVTSTIDEIGTSQIIIEKALTNPDGTAIESDEEYEFTVNLYTDETKSTIINTPFSVQIDRANGEIDYHSTESGKQIYIAAGDVAKILGVPIGTYYVIEEGQDDRFLVSANGKEGYVVEGQTAEYGFKVNLYTNQTKAEVVTDTFTVEIIKANRKLGTETISADYDDIIYIGAGDVAKIKGIPVGTYYEIEEIQDDQFLLVEGSAVGTINSSETVLTVRGANTASFVNMIKGYSLPDTGGSGIWLYVVGGIALMSSAVLMYITKQRSVRKRAQ